MKEDLRSFLASIVKELFDTVIPIELSVPDEKFGDFATNAAMQLAKTLNQNPRDIAVQMVDAINAKSYEGIQTASVAGPGFINVQLTDAKLVKAFDTATKTSALYAGEEVVVEYSDPNPFKVLHAGHIYTSVVGAAIANLFEYAGATVHRVNFGGDVGLHVAKTIWAILQDLGGEHPEKLSELPVIGRSEWMAKCYVVGTREYEDNETAKASIIELNKRVYELFSRNDHESAFAQIYWTCRQWSYDYFDAFYERIGTPFEKYYPESDVAPLGLKTVREQLEKGVYQESDGAVVFAGDKFGLHTRVFINGQGLPTYEAKDVGLIMKKWQDYHFDRSIVITGNDIEEYMKVVLKSVEQFAPELVERTTHITHGNVKLQGNVKMSSRKGNFLRAIDVLDVASEASKEATGRAEEYAVLGAVKYSFLKQRIGPNIIFEPKESVSLEGNSGPYLQYAHARARSILHKAGVPAAGAIEKLDPAERTLVRKIGEYNAVMTKALEELLPHHVCTYLYELAQVFNSFYEHTRIIGDSREALRLRLVAQYADVLRSGLMVLGIAAPEHM
jgi:arginyl-tRNA synthetase